MHRPLQLGAIIAVMLAATLRLVGTLASDVKQPSDLQSVRELVIAEWNQLSADDISRRAEISPRLAEAGVTEITVERFDTQALVVIRPGHDAKPGTAGVDDNANGIVDEDGELGATGSDDVCVVLPNEQSLQSLTGPTLALQRGAFVPVTGDERTETSHQRRAIVRGQTEGDRWSFLVALP